MSNIVLILKTERKSCYLLGNFDVNLFNVDTHNDTQGFIVSMYSVSSFPTITKPTRSLVALQRWISGKNICPPKHYLNGKNGTAITNPKDIANGHAAVFTDNSSSVHYSATFQAIKEQEEKVKIDFTSDNTDVYNKPFRLRYLRRSIMEAKPSALRPDGIHNNLLQHLPEDTLKILKEILNKIWISADFPNNGEHQRWSQSPSPIKTILAHSVTDPLLWAAAYAKSWSAWLIPASCGILKNMGY